MALVYADIVERLREMCPSSRDYNEELHNKLLIQDAIREIEALRKQLETMKEELEDERWERRIW
jgi:predicted RNase H-like nuclease (RuvC/YqgF family)